MGRFGLIGETLAHSHSPAVHALLGDDSYRLLPMPANELDSFLRGGTFDGLNVTIPYKRAVLPYCAELGEAARAIGSVNTIVRRADGTLLGDNTDAYGFARMAASAGIDFAGRRALVLGSGGTSLTACHVIRSQGGEPIVISRNGAHTYDDLPRYADVELIVNATPVGMYPHADASPVDLTGFKRLEGVLDVVYNPLRTMLLQQARALGIPCTGGLTMLVRQAARARELFDGRAVPEQTVISAERQMRRNLTNLVLIGMPGSGKSTLGKRCANVMGRAFVDIDALVTEKAGKSIPHIFAEDGEETFRALESQTIAEASAHGGIVLATGGGVVLRPENRAHLCMTGAVVRLERPLERLALKGRPLSTGADELLRMQALREPCYAACADRTVRNDGTLAEATRQIEEAFDEILGD